MGLHPKTPPGSVRRSCPSPSIYRNPRPAQEIRPAGRRRAAFVDHFVLLRFIGIRARHGKSVPRVVAGQRSSIMPFSFDLSESTPGAGNPSRGSPPGSVRRSCPSPSIYRNPCPAREIRPAGRRRAAFVDHFVLLRFIGIRARRGKSVPRVAAGQRSSVMPFSFDLSESTPGAGNPSRGSSSENAAGQRSSVMPFSFDLSESTPGAGNPSRGSPPGSVRRSCPSPSIYRNPCPAREIRPAGRRRAAFVGHALLLRSIGIHARRGKSTPRVAAGQRSSVMPFSFDLSESVSGAGNPSRGSPPGGVRRSCPSPSIYRNPRPAREIRPAGRCRAAFVDHFVLLRSIGIRVRRGKFAPWVVAGQHSSVMAFPSQCGSKSDKYREISPRGAKNLLFSGRNLRFSIKIYMF